MKTKQETAQHTPTPWIAEHTNGKDRLLVQAKYGGDEIATIWYGGHGHLLPDQKANAAFIVRAVNAHEELLAIAREDRRRYPDGSGRARELDTLIAKSEGK